MQVILIKVSLLIFVMSWVSERTKILINKRCSQWCTCVMKNNDLSVLCTQRPWFIKVALLVIIIIRTFFDPKKKGRCWCLPLNILLTGQTLGWEVTEIGCTQKHFPSSGRKRSISQMCSKTHGWGVSLTGCIWPTGCSLMLFGIYKCKEKISA